MNAIKKFFVRRRIKGMLGEYVDPAIVDRMVSSADAASATPEEAEISPVFVNMQSYVSIAERLPLRQLSELMDAYFEACGHEIAAEGGTIDKFIGDSVVAMFGAPLPTHDHGLRACLAALRIQNRVGRLRTQLRREGDKWPEPVRQLRVRVGINTGVALIGASGSFTRFNCTMMGDEVNLAARLESAAKSWGVGILCAEATKRACDRTFHGRVLFRCLGPVVVAGRSTPTELFEPAALEEEASDQLRECIQVFESGLSRWRRHDWEGAIEAFERSARLERDQPTESPEVKTNPSLIYLEIAHSHRANRGIGPMGL